MSRSARVGSAQNYVEARSTSVISRSNHAMSLRLVPGEAGLNSGLAIFIPNIVYRETRFAAQH